MRVCLYGYITPRCTPHNDLGALLREENKENQREQGRSFGRGGELVAAMHSEASGLCLLSVCLATSPHHHCYQLSNHRP